MKIVSLQKFARRAVSVFNRLFEFPTLNALERVLKIL